MQSENTAQIVQKLSEDWANAELRSGTNFMQQVLDDTFVAIGPRGFMLTKADWLQRYASGDLKNETFVWDEVTVRVYDTAAIVRGRQTTKGTYQNQEIQGQFRTTLIWVKSQDRWLLAGLHLSPIAGRPQS